MVHVLLVVVLVIACACNRSGAPEPATSSPAEAPAGAPADAAASAKPVPAALPDVLARVNGETVTKAELEEAVAAVEQRNQGPVPVDQRDRVFRGVLDQLVAFKLLAQEAAARKIAVADADVDTQIAQMRQQFPSEDVFNQALKQQNKTVAMLKADARSNIAIQKMLEQQLAGKIAVTPEQAKDFYDKNPQQFQRPEQVRASHILIGVPQGADVAAKAAVRRKAEGVLKQVKAGGDFGALARTNSEDPGSAVNGGDLGFFPRGQMVPPVRPGGVHACSGRHERIGGDAVRLSHHPRDGEERGGHDHARRSAPEARGVFAERQPAARDAGLRGRAESQR